LPGQSAGIGRFHGKQPHHRRYKQSVIPGINGEAQFSALRYFTLDDIDPADHADPGQADRRYIAWRNYNADDAKLRTLVNTPNVARWSTLVACRGRMAPPRPFSPDKRPRRRVQQTHKKDRSANREPDRLTKHKRTHNLHGTRKHGKTPHDPIALQEKPGEDPNS
jgi:hypothetical protein